MIRTLKAEPQKGINRITWELDVRGVRYPDTPKPKEESAERGGRNVVPGDYLVRISYGDAADSTTVAVLPGPKLQMSLEDMVAKAELIDRFLSKDWTAFRQMVEDSGVSLVKGY